MKDTRYVWSKYKQKGEETYKTEERKHNTIGVCTINRKRLNFLLNGISVITLLN